MTALAAIQPTHGRPRAARLSFLGLMSTMAMLAMPPQPSVAAERCSPGQYEVTIDRDIDREIVDRTRNSDHIARLLKSTSLPGYTTQGVTLVQYSSGHRTEFESEQLPDGRWCSRIKRAALVFEFSKPPVIYISNAIRIGSCLDRVVMEHEREHLGIAVDTLTKGRNHLVNGVLAIAQGGGVVARTPEEGTRMLSGAIEKSISKITTGLYVASQARNQRLDTPESYAALSGRCR